MNNRKKQPSGTRPAKLASNGQLAKTQSAAPKPRLDVPRAKLGHVKDKALTKPLLFAALRRVSTEQQEKEGESLNTQRNQIEQAVAGLGGKIVGWYGGQEHATPGHEKNEIARLMADAPSRKFDAVMVTDADRWSRDNVSSQDGLDVFKRSGVKFFTGAKEWNLFNPSDKMFLGMSAVIGEFYASNQKRKSIENRITRAERGIPTGGKLPFGRKFIRDENRQSGNWEIDPEKQRLVKDAAKRYLAGETIVDLAAKYGMNGSNLHKILVKISGQDWQLEFNSDELNIHKTVPMTIPALLDERTIAAIRAKVEANRTFTHGHIKHHYLFARMISCAHCGYAMFGQTNHNGHRYYRHAHAARDRECPGAKAKTWIPAEVVEDAAMRHLFETFGNPSAVQKAIQKATPDFDKMQELAERRNSITDDLEKLKQSRSRILDLVVKDAISENDSTQKLMALKEREAKLNEESARLASELAHVPNREAVQMFSQEIGGRIRQYTNAKLQAKIATANEAFAEMSYAEKRELCQMLFSGKTVDDRRMGVWVSWSADGKKWQYRIEGHLIDETGPLKKDQFVFGSPHLQKALVNKSANYSRGRDLPARRSCARARQWCR